MHWYIIKFTVKTNTTVHLCLQDSCGGRWAVRADYDSTCQFDDNIIVCQALQGITRLSVCSTCLKMCLWSSGRFWTLLWILWIFILHLNKGFVVSWSLPWDFSIWLKTRHRRQLTSKIKQAVNIDKKLEQTVQEKTHEDEMEVNSITDWD